MKNLNTILAVGAVTAACGAASGGLVTLASQNFDSMAASATSSLPSGWRVNSTASYSTGTTAVTQYAGTSGTGVLTGTSSGGTYLFVNGVRDAAGTDKAVGFLTSSGFSSPRSLMFAYSNNTGYDLASFTASWDYEKYRSGSRAFDWTFFASTDGATWTSVAGGDQSYAADANSTTVLNPPSSISKSVAFNVNVVAGGTLYLRWTYTGVGGSTNAQGLAVDNFVLTPAPGAVALLGVAGLVSTRRRR